MSDNTAEALVIIAIILASLVSCGEPDLIDKWGDTMQCEVKS